MVDLDKPVRLHVALTKKGDSLMLDFSATSDQNRGPINARPPIIIGCCLYALVCMMDDPPPNMASARGRNARWMVFVPDRQVTWDNYKLKSL